MPPVTALAPSDLLARLKEIVGGRHVLTGDASTRRYRSGFRYGESGYTRQNTGGCGFWNNDANWANNSALPTINNAVKNGAAQTGLPNIKVLELQATLKQAELGYRRQQELLAATQGTQGLAQAAERAEGL